MGMLNTNSLFPSIESSKLMNENENENETNEIGIGGDDGCISKRSCTPTNIQYRVLLMMKRKKRYKQK